MWMTFSWARTGTGRPLWRCRVRVASSHHPPAVGAFSWHAAPSQLLTHFSYLRCHSTGVLDALLPAISQSHCAANHVVIVSIHVSEGPDSFVSPAPIELDDEPFVISDIAAVTATSELTFAGCDAVGTLDIAQVDELQRAFGTLTCVG